MSELRVEVVFALEERQSLVSVSVPAGSTVADAIDSSGLRDLFPDYDLLQLPVGIWGRPVDRQRKVQSGDRIEIYRPLQMDPMEARRQRALAGGSMGSIEAD